jgi:hypothetical protein
MSNRINDYIVEECKYLYKDYNMLLEIFNERSQIYGSLINLMLDTGKTELVIKYADLRGANSYLLTFIPDNEAKELKLKLVENPEPEKEIEKDE